MNEKLKEFKGKVLYRYQHNYVFPKTMIYVMKEHDTGAYKIGCSIDPKRRENELKKKKPSIELLFHSEMVENIWELIWHSFFVKRRIQGEWFGLTDEDLAFIKKELTDK